MYNIARTYGFKAQLPKHILIHVIACVAAQEAINGIEKYNDQYFNFGMQNDGMIWHY